MKTSSLVLLAALAAAAPLARPAENEAKKYDFSLKGAADSALKADSTTAFGGSILITTDADWRMQLKNANGSMPVFKEVDALNRGQKAWVLVFFRNARPDADGQLNVTCDLRVVRPDGTAASEQKGLTCFKGRVEGSPGNFRLVSQEILFVGEPKDPPGTWRVEVRVKDQVKGVEVPLLAVFTLRR